MLISVGYGNLMNVDKIIGVTNYISAPIKRDVFNAKDIGKCIDVTEGHRTNSVIYFNDGYIALSTNTPSTINKKIRDKINEDDLNK